MKILQADSLSRRSFLGLSALALSPSVFSQEENQTTNETIDRPNLVVILADDLGYGDLGCYGCRDIATPNLDRLAQGGVRLTDAYAPAPVCTPTRCSLMTGCYPQRQPDLEWAIYPEIQSIGLPAGQPTLPSMLRDKGYTTGMFGKWHLGEADAFAPNQHGFTEFFGFRGGNLDYFRHVNDRGTPDLYENANPVQKTGYLTDLITERSTDFIQRNAQKPSFLYTAFNAPHWPIQGPDDESANRQGVNYSKAGDRQAYARMVERVDWGVGQILDALRKNGLEEKTFVVFLSDNGGDRLSNNGPLRDYKGTLWEGGIRIPCICSWPGVLPAGRVSHQAAIVMDVVVSLLAASGVRPTRRIDGMNLLPYIAGIRPDVEQTFVWRNNWHGQKALRWGKWKWLKIKDEEYLFNLEDDIAEQINRKERNCDIAYWLRDIYRQWETAMPYNQTLFGEELRKFDEKKG